MKMKFSAIPVVLLMILSLFSLQACSAAQFANVVSEIQAQLPAIESAVTTVAAFAAPEVLPMVTVVGAAANVDLPLLKAAVTDWQANPSASTRQKIESLVDDLVTKVDAQLLAANGLTKTPVVQAFLMALGILATALHAIDGLIISAQSAKQAKATAARRTAKLEQVLPLLDRRQLEDAAERHGTSLVASVRYAQALGY